MWQTESGCPANKTKLAIGGLVVAIVLVRTRLELGRSAAAKWTAGRQSWLT
jgi:hypothetical protein